MTLAETLQIKHFQLRAGPELKANSCATHSLSPLLILSLARPLCFPPVLFYTSFISLSTLYLIQFLFFSPYLISHFLLFILFVFQHMKSCGLSVVVFFFKKRRLKVNFSFLLFFPPCCLMGGTPRCTQTHTHSIIKYYGCA